MSDMSDRLTEECEELKKDVKRLGKQMDGVWSVPFGVLFDDDKAQSYYEALIGTLKAAKKRKIVDFKGQMLLKGMHDKVPIVLLEAAAPVEEAQTVKPPMPTSAKPKLAPPPAAAAPEVPKAVPARKINGQAPTQRVSASRTSTRGKLFKVRKGQAGLKEGDATKVAKPRSDSASNVMSMLNGKSKGARRLVGEGDATEARDMKAGKTHSARRRLSLEGTLPVQLTEDEKHAKRGAADAAALAGSEEVVVEKEAVEEKEEEGAQVGLAADVRNVTKRASLQMRTTAAAAQELAKLKDEEAAAQELAKRKNEEAAAAPPPPPPKEEAPAVAPQPLAIAENGADVVKVVDPAVGAVAGEMTEEEEAKTKALEAKRENAKRQSTLDMASQYKTKNFSRKMSASRGRKDSIGRKSGRGSKRGSKDSLSAAVEEIERKEKEEAERAAKEMEATWMTKGVVIQKRLSAQESFEACIGSAREYHRAIVTIYGQKHQGWDGGGEDHKCLKAISPIEHIFEDGESDESDSSDSDSGGEGGEAAGGGEEEEKLPRGQREANGRDQYGEVRCFGLPLPALIISDGGALTPKQKEAVLARSNICCALALAPPSQGAMHIRAGRMYLQQLERVMWVLLDDLVSKAKKFLKKWLVDPQVFHALSLLVMAILFKPGPDQLSLVNWRCAGGFEIDGYELGLKMDDGGYEEDEDEDESEDGMDDEDVMVVTHSKDAIVGNDEESDTDVENGSHEPKVEVHRRRSWHAIKGCYSLLNDTVTAETTVVPKKFKKAVYTEQYLRMVCEAFSNTHDTRELRCLMETLHALYVKVGVVFHTHVETLDASYNSLDASSNLLTFFPLLFVTLLLRFLQMNTRRTIIRAAIRHEFWCYIYYGEGQAGSSATMIGLSPVVASPADCRHPGTAYLLNLLASVFGGLKPQFAGDQQKEWYNMVRKTIVPLHSTKHVDKYIMPLITLTKVPHETAHDQTTTSSLRVCSPPSARHAGLTFALYVSGVHIERSISWAGGGGVFVQALADRQCKQEPAASRFSAGHS
jgi:hypothetical protein